MKETCNKQVLSFLSHRKSGQLQGTEHVRTQGRQAQHTTRENIMKTIALSTTSKNLIKGNLSPTFFFICDCLPVFSRHNFSVLNFNSQICSFRVVPPPFTSVELKAELPTCLSDYKASSLYHQVMLPSPGFSCIPHRALNVNLNDFFIV